MASARETPAVREARPPVLRDGRLHCPRCGARLAFDRDQYTCIACGYEYPVSERELEVARARRSRRGVAAGLALLLLEPAVAGALLAAAGVALVATWLWRARRGG